MAKIRYVSGVEGNHIEINDMRVCGPKAWGEGRIIKEWDVKDEDILNALNASQPTIETDAYKLCSECGERCGHKVNCYEGMRRRNSTI